MTALARDRLTACSWCLRRAALLLVLVGVVMRMVMGVIVCFNAMRVSFFSVGVLVSRAVRVATRAMAVADVVEEYETDNVRGETEGSDDKNELGLRDLLGFDESLDSLEEDGETEGD